jgi:hypothetical protein
MLGTHGRDRPVLAESRTQTPTPPARATFPTSQERTLRQARPRRIFLNLKNAVLDGVPRVFITRKIASDRYAHGTQFTDAPDSNHPITNSSL